MNPRFKFVRLRTLALLATAGAVPALLPAVSHAQNNTFYGSGALLSGSTTGSDSSAFGFDALYHNTTGTLNSAFGEDALYSNTTGASNTATGQLALDDNTTGGNNTADGRGALLGNTQGSDNVAIGFAALYKNKTGGSDSAVGYEALYSNTNGSFNLAVGYGALYGNETGSYNTADGTVALENEENGSENTALGYGALETANGGSNNIGIGVLGGGSITTGSNNIDIGNTGFAGESNIIRIGDGATQTDCYLTGVIHGNGSGLTGIPGLNEAGTGNVGVGSAALSSNGGADDTATGDDALETNSGSYNVADGAAAMGGAPVGGVEDDATGAYALYSLTTGANNDAMGFEALFYNTSGADNAGFGSYCLLSNTTGQENTAVGYGALENLSAGSGNTGIGVIAGTMLTSGDNNIYLGNSGVTSKESDVMRLGALDTITNTYIAGSTVGINESTPTAGTLDFNGGYIIAEGLSGARPYIGDDGSGQDVQLGSYVSGITNVSCYNEVDHAFMHLTVSSITINGGSDLAEPFRISKAKQPVVEGDVVVIDDANPGQLKLTDQPYDTRVAGVVSGANGIHPGIRMQQQGLLAGGRNVALSGRVYVQADTSNGPIRPGDQLTTSTTPGRAMKVTDHARAQGAILGKAMTRLDNGPGMVLVLVTLQ